MGGKGEGSERVLGVDRGGKTRLMGLQTVATEILGRVLEVVHSENHTGKNRAELFHRLLTSSMHLLASFPSYLCYNAKTSTWNLED